MMEAHIEWKQGGREGRRERWCICDDAKYMYILTITFLMFWKNVSFFFSNIFLEQNIIKSSIWHIHVVQPTMETPGKELCLQQPLKLGGIGIFETAQLV